jgi:hypothetical protein
MNNKAIIFAQHRHRLTKFDATIVTLALIFTALVGGFSQPFSESGQSTPNEATAEVEAQNHSHQGR